MKKKTAVDECVSFFADVLAVANTSKIQTHRAALKTSQVSLDESREQLMAELHRHRDDEAKRNELRQSVRETDKRRDDIRNFEDALAKLVSVRSLVHNLHKRAIAPPKPARQPRLKYELRPVPPPMQMVCVGAEDDV